MFWSSTIILKTMQTYISCCNTAPRANSTSCSRSSTVLEKTSQPSTSVKLFQLLSIFTPKTGPLSIGISSQRIFCWTNRGSLSSRTSAGLTSCPKMERELHTAARRSIFLLKWFRSKVTMSPSTSGALACSFTSSWQVMHPSVEKHRVLCFRTSALLIWHGQVISQTSQRIW